MPYSLVTSPDERERCCYVSPDGIRCGQRTAWRVSGEAWDEYAYCCGDHVQAVSRDSPGCKVGRVDE